MTISTFLVVLLQTAVVLFVALLISRMTEAKAIVRVTALRFSLVLSAVLLIAGGSLVMKRNPMVAIQVPERMERMAPTQDTPVVSRDSAPTSIDSTSESAKPIASVKQTVTPNAGVVAGSVSVPAQEWTLSQIVGTVYAVGILVFLSHLGVGLMAIRRVRSRSNLVTSGTLYDSLVAISTRNRIRVPRLYVGESVEIPFVSGVVRQEIFVPCRWLSEDNTELFVAVLEHEIAHISARDVKWKLFGKVACIALWFQPLAWLVNRRMNEATEEHCDLRVLESGISKTDYAKTLLLIREKAKSLRVSGIAIGAVGRESMLSKRVKKILANDRIGPEPRSVKTKWISITGLSLAATLSAFLIAQPARVQQMSGSITLFNHQGLPVYGGRAWLVTYRRDFSPILRQLTVNGNKVEVTDEANPKPHTSMLAVRTKEGMIDYVLLAPDKPMPTSFKIAKPVRIRGKIDLPKNLLGPVRLKTMMISSHKSTPQAPSQFTMLAISELRVLEQGATTDAFGNFEMGYMLSGSEVTLQVDDDRISQDWADMKIKIDDNGHSPFFHHAARLGGSVEGRVTRDGKPIEGIRVTAQGQGKSGWGETVSDRNGNYRISRLEPDKYNVAAYLTIEQRQEFTTVAQENLTIKVGDRKTGVNILAVRGGVIVGVVLDQQGHPAPDAQIGIYGSSHPHSTGGVQGETADSSGHFRARVAAGDHQVYYMGSNGAGELVPVRVRDGEETSVRVHFPVKRPVKWIIQDEKPSKTVDDLIPTMIKDSTIVSLELLCRKTANVTQVWRPNGGKPKIMRVDGPTSTIDQSISDGLSNGFHALVGIENLRSQMERIFFHSNSNFGSGSVGFATMSGKAWIPIGNTDEELQDFKIGIPVDYYKVHYKGKLNSNYTIQKDAIGGQKLVFNVSANLAKKDLVLNATTSTGTVLRMSAGVFDKHGFVHGPTQYERSIDSGTGIVSVEVLYRDVAWVTFKGVHMKPN